MIGRFLRTTSLLLATALFLAGCGQERKARQGEGPAVVPKGMDMLARGFHPSETYGERATEIAEVGPDLENDSCST